MLSSRSLLHHCLLVFLLGVFLAACGSDDEPPAGAVPPSISVQPVSITAVAGESASFAVTATGDGIAYQWQQSVDGSDTWNAVAGATDSTLQIQAVDPSLNGSQYRVVVTAGTATVTSSPVVLTVSAAAASPTINVQPIDQSVAVGTSVSFTVTATGGSLEYQWQLSTDGITWLPIVGSTTGTLILANVSTADSGKRYRVVVSNGTSSAQSDAATLTVLEASQHFLYTLLLNSRSIVAYAINNATGALAAVGSPYAIPGAATITGLTISSNKRYIYVATSTGTAGGVYGIAIEEATGQLTSVSESRFGTGAGLSQLVAHPNGRFLYAAADTSSTSGVESFVVDSSTGNLQSITGSLVAGGRGASLTIDSAGRFLYQLQVVYQTNGYEGKVFQYAIDQASGALTLLPGNTVLLPGGSLVYGPFFSPSGRFAYFVSADGTLAAYTVQPSDGVLTPIAGSPYTVTPSTNFGTAMTFDSTGKFGYIDRGVNSAGQSLKAVYGVALDASTGVPTVLPGSPYGAVLPAIAGNGESRGCGTTLAPNGHFMLQGGNGAASLSIDAATGALNVASIAQQQPLGGGSCPAVFEPSGHFVYEIGVFGIYGYSFDQASGVLASISGIPSTATAASYLFR